jgi:hypothetical protein
MKRIYDPAPNGYPPEPYVPSYSVALRGDAQAPPACLTASEQRRLSRSLAGTDPFGYRAGTYAGSTPATNVSWRSWACFSAQRPTREIKCHVVVGRRPPSELFRNYCMTFRTRLAALLVAEL